MVRGLGFSGEYVEKITPNERQVFMMLYRQEQEEANKKKQNNGEL